MTIFSFLRILLRSARPQRGEASRWKRASGEKRDEEAKESVGAVEGDDMAAVFDEVADELVGDRLELAVKAVADGAGADGHGGHVETSGVGRGSDLLAVHGAGPLTVTQAPQVGGNHRWVAARAGMMLVHSCQVCGQPCSRTTAGPRPVVDTCREVPLVSI
jgi:hypothetical protein